MSASEDSRPSKPDPNVLSIATSFQTLDMGSAPSDKTSPKKGRKSTIKGKGKAPANTTSYYSDTTDSDSDDSFTALGRPVHQLRRVLTAINHGEGGVHDDSAHDAESEGGAPTDDPADESESEYSDFEPPENPTDTPFSSELVEDEGDPSFLVTGNRLLAKERTRQELLHLRDQDLHLSDFKTFPSDVPTASSDNQSSAAPSGQSGNEGSQDRRKPLPPRKAKRRKATIADVQEELSNMPAVPKGVKLGQKRRGRTFSEHRE